jgi:hypothetical protein
MVEFCEVQTKVLNYYVPVLRLGCFVFIVVGGRALLLTNQNQS